MMIYIKFAINNYKMINSTQLKHRLNAQELWAKMDKMINSLGKKATAWGAKNNTIISKPAHP